MVIKKQRLSHNTRFAANTILVESIPRLGDKKIVAILTLIVSQVIKMSPKKIKNPAKFTDEMKIFIIFILQFSRARTPSDIARWMDTCTPFLMEKRIKTFYVEAAVQAAAVPIIKK